MADVWDAQVHRLGEAMIECRVTGPVLSGLTRSAGARAAGYARAHGVRIVQRISTRHSAGEGFTACVWSRYRVSTA